MLIRPTQLQFFKEFRARKKLEFLEFVLRASSSHILLAQSPFLFILLNDLVKVSVKENEVPIEKNSSCASIFATKASLIYIKLKLKD